MVFMIYFSVWFPDLWISCKFWELVFVLVSNTLWFNVYFQSGFRIIGLAVDFGSQSLFWSDTSADFKDIPYGFMFIFQPGFTIIGLAIDFGSQSLFWSGTSP